MKKNIINYLILFVVLIMPSYAFAQQGSGVDFLNKLVSNSTFKKTIDMGLILLAGYQWFMYLNGFKPEGAFKDIIIPAAITFFAFNWVRVLSWVGLVSFTG